MQGNNQNGSSSRSALRRLLIVVAVVVGVFIYAYGWRVTDIGLEETQDPTRQDSVTRALRELLAPDIFEQDTESTYVDTDFLVGCLEGAEPSATAQPAGEGGASYIVLTPACGSSGDLIMVEGYNFLPGADAFLRWVPTSGQTRPLVRVDVDGGGYFQTEIEVPSIRGSQGEIHQIEVEESVPVGAPYLSDATFTVLEKMVETIFLALMATTLALPIAVLLSFFAARNLSPHPIVFHATRQVLNCMRGIN
ncbi:MAG: hypothetical protein JW910_11580, partial [Anaerolineae bacterium]|nr:hypothetical protein [Anaerolineae bacterium]